MGDAEIQTPDWLLQMENILETLNEGVAIVDDGLRVVFANEALLRLSGYELGEMRGPHSRCGFCGGGSPLFDGTVRDRPA